MRNLKIFTGLIILTAALVSGCKKNTRDLSYRDVDRISLSGDALQLATADSTLFTFTYFGADTTAYHLHVVATLAGNLSTVDRQFTIAPIASATTALPTEYTLPSTLTLKAGNISTAFTVRVKRTGRLTSNVAKLMLQVTPNNNFQAGLHPIFSLVWTDQLAMPQNWVGSLQYYFGLYSKVKHSLLVQAQSQYKDFTQLTGLYPQIFAVASAGLDSLNRYNAAHPTAPMKNESGVAIGICNGCK